MDALLNGIYIYGITVIMMIIIAYNMSESYIRAIINRHKKSA